MQNTVTKNEGNARAPKRLKWWGTTLIVLGSVGFVLLAGYLCCTLIG